MAPQHFGKIGIALRCEHGNGVACCPEQNPGDPHPQTEPERRRYRAVDDGQGARRTSQQNRFGQRAMQRNLEAFDHETSAPPPNEKNERKKLDAANAMERPNTI